MAKSTNKTGNTEVKETKTYSQEQLDLAVSEAVKKALAEFSSKQTATPVLQVAKEEYVTLLFLDAIASGTTVALGDMGSINRAGEAIQVSKKDFLKNLGNRVVDALLKQRELVVIDGLTAEERKRYGVDYKESELLTQDTYYKLLDYDDRSICALFNALCEEHKIIVAKMYSTAYFEKKDNRINLERIKALNTISKKTNKEGLFTPILEDMGKKIAE